jgi:hypothetical protein
MDKGELLAIAAAARASRDWVKIRTALEMLVAAEPGSIEAVAWLREKAQIEEDQLGDLEGAHASWKALAALSPDDVEARDAVERIGVMRG